MHCGFVSLCACIDAQGKSKAKKEVEVVMADDDEEACLIPFLLTPSLHACFSASAYL